MKMLKLFAGMLIVAFNGFHALAGITYESTNIVVLNYPADAPATLSDIRAADSNGAWGIVQYDPSTDTTTLTNHLIIGGANGSNSFLQIGRTNYLAEILVIKGNLRVKTPSSACRNGLLLGTSVTNTVQPVLKFDCSPGNIFGLYMESGVVLTSYNAVVTSTTTNQWLGSFYNTDWRELYMTNTTFLCGSVYPLSTFQGTVANCTFANGPYALINGGYFEGCMFSNLTVALQDCSSIQCTLVRCTFTNNAQNWTLSYTDHGIRAVDCWIGLPQNTNIVCQRNHFAWEAHWHYPTFVAQRHFVVNVKDGAGIPIASAVVTVSNEQQDADAVIHGLTVTGTNGLTPAIDSEQALFVNDYLYRATEDAAQPLYKQYTYTLTASAPGYATNQVTGVDPNQSWTTQAITLVP